MMAYTSVPIAAIDRTAPTGSSRVACGSRESGTRCSAPTSAATSSGTLIQNTDDHEKLRISAPPTIGPRAMPSAAGRGPYGDGLGPLAGVAEHVDEDRQRGRHDQRAADAHDAAADDQRGRRAGRGGDDRAGEERGQAGERARAGGRTGRRGFRR